MAGLLVNPVFVRRFFSDHGGSDGNHSGVDPSITGITVACLQVSAAVGSLLAGRLGDIIGRKKCVRIGGFIYFVCSFIQAFSPNLACFIFGRTLQGVAVGFLSMTVPVIQTEIAAPHRRGLMVGVEYTFLIGGYALSCWVDYGFFFALPSNVSWQGPYFVQMGLSFILFAMSFFLPETPRWLARNGFEKESLQVVADLHANGNINDAHVQHVFLEIQEAVRYEATLGESTWTVSAIGTRGRGAFAKASFRKCSRDTGSEPLLVAPLKCLLSSTASTSYPSIFPARLLRPASPTRSLSSTPRQTLCPTPLRQ